MHRSTRSVHRAFAPGLPTALRRLADSLERGGSFRIQILGERIRVPRDAQLSIEHERDDDEKEIELQMRWTPDGTSSSDEDDDDDSDDDDEDSDDDEQ